MTNNWVVLRFPRVFNLNLLSSSFMEALEIIPNTPPKSPFSMPGNHVIPFTNHGEFLEWFCPPLKGRPTNRTGSPLWGLGSSPNPESHHVWSRCFWRQETDLTLGKTSSKALCAASKEASTLVGLNIVIKATDRKGKLCKTSSRPGSQNNPICGTFSHTHRPLKSKSFGINLPKTLGVDKIPNSCNFHPVPVQTPTLSFSANFRKFYPGKNSLLSSPLIDCLVIVCRPPRFCTGSRFWEETILYKGVVVYPLGNCRNISQPKRKVGNSFNSKMPAGSFPGW